MNVVQINTIEFEDLLDGVYKLEKRLDKIDEKMISEFSASPIENIDLLIRTGGDKRISNFLLWKIAYAELYFSNVL